MELTKKVIVKDEKKGWIVYFVIAGVLVAYAVIFIAVLLSQGNFDSAIVGYVIAIIALLIAIALVVWNIKSINNFNNSLNEPWYYKTYECIDTKIVEHQDDPVDFYVFFKDGDKKYRIKNNELKDKISAGELLIFVVSSNNNPQRPSLAKGAWYLSGREYHISESNTEFVYTEEIVPRM